MDKERSKGVTFWGWLFIISSIISLFQQISPKQQIQSFGIGIFVFTVVVSLGFLICGIFILKLNETARKTAILLCVISILSMPVYIRQIVKVAKSEDFYTIAKQRIIEQTKPEYQPQALERLEKSREQGKKALSTVITAIVVLWLIFELIPIYFFTRAPIKEQFKQT
jgi:hypothetical protein